MVAATVFVLSQSSPLRTVEQRYSDVLMTWLDHDRQPSEDIVIVKITEDTLAKIAYRSPFDRSLLAQVVKKILSANPKSIGIDVLLDQASEPAKDEELFAVLRSSPDKIAVAFATTEDGLSDAQADYENKNLAGVTKATVVLAKDNTDGIVRYYLESRVIGQKIVPTLAHVMDKEFSAGQPGNYTRIFYQNTKNSKPHEFTEYPAHSVPLLPAAWFKDKYVFIGMDLPRIDRYRTPFASMLGEISGSMPGVIIHAHILDQLLSGTKLSELGPIAIFALLCFAALAGILIVRIRQSIWIRMLVLAATFPLIIGASVFLFKSASLITPAMSISVAMTMAALIASAILWQADRNEKRFVRDAWTHYVSSVVVEDMIAHPEKLSLGGEKMDVSFIFTDIAGFTSLAEGMEVEKLSPILNSYLDRVSAEFLKADATIDKIVGDAVIGFIGAPVVDNDHPNKAVGLAIAIDRVCCQFQEEMEADGVDFGHTRIGVHSGPAIIGNFGGSNFFDYTALGDTVNTAARLEGANKIFGSHVCISGATVGRATDHLFRPLGRLLLAGKTKLVDAWEPVAALDKDCAPVEEYNEAYKLLDAGSDKAHAALEKLAKSHPNDYLISCHLERVKNGNRGTMIDLTKGPKL